MRGRTPNFEKNICILNMIRILEMRTNETQGDKTVFSIDQEKVSATRTERLELYTEKVSHDYRTTNKTLIEVTLQSKSIGFVLSKQHYI